jgi:hypothetical protein
MITDFFSSYLIRTYSSTQYRHQNGQFYCEMLPVWCLNFIIAKQFCGIGAEIKMGYVSRQSWSRRPSPFAIPPKRSLEHPNLPNYAWGTVSKGRSWLAVVFTGSEVSTVLVRVRVSEFPEPCHDNSGQNRFLAGVCRCRVASDHLGHLLQ